MAGPKRRASDRWRPIAAIAAVGALAVLLAVGGLVATAAFDARHAARNAEQGSAAAEDETLLNREIGWQRGAVDCLVMLVDNDRTFAMPAYCMRAQVIAWYPPEVCPLLGSPAGCGTRSGEIGPGG